MNRIWTVIRSGGESPNSQKEMINAILLQETMHPQISSLQLDVVGGTSL